jgi:hypothetical protein
MTSVEDFTGLALGAEVALEGRVSRCSRCGRNGIEQGRGEGLSYYVIHVQTSRVLGDGMRIEPRDFCVLPHPGRTDGDGAMRAAGIRPPLSVQRPPARA